MEIHREIIVLCLLCNLILSIVASSCPERRKPHVTSCTIFYNCINLPEGGYVWAPSKCPDGLVFQPYLLICVLPGDTWTCDTLATESSVVTEHYESPESIDPARNSYLGYTHELSPFTGNPSIGASYPIDEISELGNVQHVATPYPLIEIIDTNDKNINKNYKVKESVTVPQATEHRVDNYLYQFFNSQRKIPSRFGTSSYDKGQVNQSTWLNGFINRMLLYENIGGTLKQEVYPQNPVITEITSTTCESNGESALKKSEYLNNLNSDVLSYIVQSYILGTKESDGISKKKYKKPTTTTESTEQSDEEIDSISASPGNRPIDLIINGPKAENNIVAIKGNLGGKEYVTIDKYKSLSREIDLEVIEILPCAKGIRLPNRTDCTKYYTCDPETAVIVQFSCSSKTAFNDYNRVCEAQRYKPCAEQLNKMSPLKVSMTDNSIKTVSALTRTEIPIKKNPCQSTGKFVDPESDRNYYVCYSSSRKSGGIDSIIMSCPNDLIFCQKRKLCTTRKRCND